MQTLSLSDVEKTRIVKQFCKLYIPLLLLIVLVAGWIGYSQVKAEISSLKSGRNFISKFAQRRILYSINVTKAHLNGLVQEDEFLHPVTDSRHNEVANAFKTLILRNPRYDQVRWISPDGQETVRVNNVAGKPVQAPEAQLQNKADRPYFIETMQLPEGEIYVGPISLNREHGVIEVPYKPTLRLAIRLPEQSKIHGILVINLLADHLFQAMNDAIERSGVPVYLLNQDGYWLHGMQTKDNWGFEFGKDTRLGHTNPRLWQKIQNSPDGAVENAQGLWSWAWAHAGNAKGMMPNWLALTYTPKRQLTDIRQRVWSIVIALVLPLLGLLGVGLYRFLLSQAIGRQSMLEVQRLASEAELAKKIQSASSVFERVVQASPVGKIIVDDAGRIAMINPRIEAMFGYAQQELLGQSVDMLIPGELRQLHQSHMQTFLGHPKSGRMGLGNTLWGLRKDGSRIPLEIGLTKLGMSRETAVMATLSDLSLRYHLIKHN
ncbi:MAG TPA: PAS domain S-box protein, partial [Methylophilus sp.]